MKLITDAGLEINLANVRVIDVKPGDSLIYKIPANKAVDPADLQQLFSSLQRLFGKEIPIMVIGQEDDIVILRDEDIIKAIKIAKETKIEEAK